MPARLTGGEGVPDRERFLVAVSVAPPTVADVILLGPLKWIEKRSPYNITYRFAYQLRDRSQTASSMFQVASFEIAQSEIVKNSQGWFRLAGRPAVNKGRALTR